MTDILPPLRQLGVTYAANTIFGVIQSEVNVNVGLSPMSPLLPQFNQPILNNMGPIAVNNTIFSSTLFWGIDIPYYIERRTDSQEFVQRGTLHLTFSKSTGLWSLNDIVDYGSSGLTTGVVFTIDGATSQVYYTSDDVTGTTYVSNLIMQSSTTFLAGN